MIKYDYTWNKLWILQFESFYSIIAKFKLSNNIEGKTIVELLKCEKPIVRNFNTLHENIPEEKMIKIFDYPIRHTIAGTINLLIFPLKVEKSTLNKYFANNLRYCPKCYGQYYHSILHQFLLLTKCPLHDIPLQEKCPNCLQTIEYSINDSRPFTCNCGYIFIKGGLNFAHFLTEMKRSKDLYKASSLTNKSLEKYLSFKDMTIFIDKTSLPASDLNVDIVSMICTKNETSNSNYKLFSLKKDIAKTKTSLQDLHKEIFFNTKATYKSIARYIRNNLLKNHRKCISKFVRLKNENNTCKKAMSYIYWKMIIEDIPTFSLVDNGSRKRDLRYTHCLCFISKTDHETLERLYRYLLRNFPENEQIIIDILNKYSAALLLHRFKAIYHFFESEYKVNSFYYDLIKYSCRQTNIILMCKKDAYKQIAKFWLI